MNYLENPYRYTNMFTPIRLSLSEISCRLAIIEAAAVGVRPVHKRFGRSPLSDSETFADPVMNHLEWPQAANPDIAYTSGEKRSKQRQRSRFFISLYRVVRDNMATRDSSLNATSEHCETCDGQTPHEVRVELVTESDKSENAHYSREPYRISECTLCGDAQSIRMNNA